MQTIMDIIQSDEYIQFLITTALLLTIATIIYYARMRIASARFIKTLNNSKHEAETTQQRLYLINEWVTKQNTLTFPSILKSSW